MRARDTDGPTSRRRSNSTRTRMGRPGWLLGRGVVLLLVVLVFSGAQTPPDDGFSFVVIGHLRGEQDNEPFYLMDELLDRVAATSPDAVFLTGDLIYGDWQETEVDASRIRAHWERLDASLARLNVPVYRVPGNHDINDPTTRDIWIERYGEPVQAVTLAGNRFLLLATPHIPTGMDPPETPRPFSRVEDLPARQVDFVRSELEDADQYDHVFLFMHHVLWWTPDRAWWSDVHPMLVDGRVRAVFAGDYGPLMFSHTRRDGIDYLQSALEWRAPGTRLRSQLGRVMNYQFDTFLNVQVRGGDVDIEVEVLGATSSGKYSPERFLQLFTSEPTVEPALRERLLNSRRVIAGAGLGLGFVAGAFVVWVLLRRRSA